MNQNYYLLEKLAEAHRQDLLREAEQQRRLNSLPREHLHITRWVAAYVGTLLVALGTSLKRLEPGRESVL